MQEARIQTHNMTDSARWKATVHVSGLATVATVATLHDAFLPFGDIADVTLPKNENPNSRDTEPHRGFAYVEFENADDAKEAIDNMDQSEFFGRVIKVTAAKIPKSADEGLGSKKAVWEQVCRPFCHFDLNEQETHCHYVNRRAGSQNMPSVRKIGWPQNKPKVLEIRELRIQCKALRVWTLPVLARLRRNRGRHQDTQMYNNCTAKAFWKKEEGNGSQDGLCIKMILLFQSWDTGAFW